jgi:hypothetical protein
MKRTDVINKMINKFGYESYLEIGLQDARQNFNHIEASHKISVDPNADAIFRMTSDEFFSINNEGFDIIFIDGLHHADQVCKDFNNAVECLNEGGCIVLHDTSPEFEQYTHVPREKPSGVWNGDVYKFAASLAFTDYSYFTVDCDHGVTCVFPHDKSQVELMRIDWKEFNEKRTEFLNIIPADGYFPSYSHF